jgi:hypothetical protein
MIVHPEGSARASGEEDSGLVFADPISRPAMTPVKDASRNSVQELKGRHYGPCGKAFNVEPAGGHLPDVLRKLFEVSVQGRPCWPGGLEFQLELLLSQGSLRLGDQQYGHRHDRKDDPQTNRSFDLHFHTSLLELPMLVNDLFTPPPSPRYYESVPIVINHIMDALYPHSIL